MENTKFENILDICIAEIRSGRATVTDCLRQYPAHAPALEPLLRQATLLTTLPRAAMPANAIDALEQRVLRRAAKKRAAWRSPGQGSTSHQWWCWLLIGALVIALALLGWWITAQRGRERDAATPQATFELSPTPLAMLTSSLTHMPGATPSQTTSPTQTSAPSGAAAPTETFTPAEEPEPVHIGQTSDEPALTGLPEKTQAPTVAETPTPIGVAETTEAHDPVGAPEPTATPRWTETPKPAGQPKPTAMSEPTKAPTPTFELTETPAPTSASEPTETPTPTPTSTPATVTSTAEAPMPTPTCTSTPTQTFLPSPTLTPTATETPTDTPEPTSTALPTSTPTATSTPASGEWDRSSLYFDPDYGCQGDCATITAQVCNGRNAEDMAGPTTWELYWAAFGNPKRGSLIVSGSITPLEADQCLTLTYNPANNPNGSSGNYMFRAYQRSGHPGTGELWSEACEITCQALPVELP